LLPFFLLYRICGFGVLEGGKGLKLVSSLRILEIGFFRGFGLWVFYFGKWVLKPEGI